MIDFDVAFDKLAGFDDPDELAVFLRDQEAVGLPQVADACPMARWLQRETGLPAAVTVFMTCPDPYGSAGRRIHSPGMRRFVIGFDSGWYPFLIDPAPRKPVC